jgi:glycine hydroxymethyltransferase
MEKRGYRIVSKGTDSHLFLVDLRPKNITGKLATAVLGEVNITVNKNLIPFDPQPPAVASGIRIGTPAIATRGIGADRVGEISDFIDRGLNSKDSQQELTQIRKEVIEFTKKFPLYPD